MGFESGNDTINALREDWPTGTDPRSKGDDHLRLLKRTLKNQFFGLSQDASGESVMASAGEMNALVGLGDNANINESFVTTLDVVNNLYKALQDLQYVTWGIATDVYTAHPEINNNYANFIRANPQPSTQPAYLPLSNLSSG